MTADWRAGGSFVLWAFAGLLLALGIASLPSVGIIVLPVGAMVSLLVARITQGRGAAGLLAGAGVMGLFIAYLHRYGPGEVCTVTPGSRTCGDYLDPVPFLVAGVAAILLGLALDWAARRRRRPSAVESRQGPVTRRG